MKFEIFERPVSNIWDVYAGESRVGEISFERGRWDFHYTAAWFNQATRELEDELWKLINEKVILLRLTSRLSR